MDNSGDVPLCVPGFALDPFFLLDMNETFVHGYDDGNYRPERITKAEIAMLAMMNEITDKLDWTKKVSDDGIVAKWKQEASNLTDKMFNWCIDELRNKATTYEMKNLVRVLDAQTAVVKSDSVITQELRTRLVDACAALSDIEDAEKDWHPGSDSKVLNLVHPSLFPAVYGRSHVLPRGRVVLQDTLSNFGAGELLSNSPVGGKSSDPPGRVEETLHKWSSNFQWLPSDVDWDGHDGVRIDSYVNNLHPIHHSSIYPVLESYISKSIPLWEACLFRRHDAPPKRIECLEAQWEPANPPDTPSNEQDFLSYMDEYTKPEGLQYWTQDYAEFNDITGEELLPRLPYHRSGLVEHLWKHKRRLIVPEPEEFDALRASRTINNLREDFPKGLQVIVKLASIELNPEKPDYEGGKWHLEGQLNEHISATSIYYYDCQNVTESRLRFRNRAILENTEMSYEQDDHEGLEKLYGLESGDLRDGAMIQQLGSIVTKEGRMLAFPNSLQHRVEPFRLQDPTKPGWRRFLVLWLVDPHYRILSTANVPPQQFAWWSEELLRRTNNLDRLPVELAGKVLENGREFTITLDEAKALRVELMAARTGKIEARNRALEDDLYNFCEH